MQSFGKAADDLENYYRYWWEQVWEKRIAPHQAEIAEQGKVFNFSRGLIWNLGKYYKESDSPKRGNIWKTPCRVSSRRRNAPGSKN